MKLFLRLGVVIATTFLLLLGILLSGWFIPVSSPPVYAFDQAPQISSSLIQCQTTTPFTPVATIFLPLVINGGGAANPKTSNIKITHIEYNPSGLDSEGEYVELQNTSGGTVDLTNWTLCDLQNPPYTFPAFTLASGAKVKIWVRSGVDTPTDLYWGRDSAIWNNDGDTATLRDSNGNDIDICAYIGSGTNPASTDCQ